ncbi:MAG TPA: IS200/IS605 family transposase [Phycisphaerae bacterium]|nr:IS200/IS605 family transposase [Phycisphaerae bacterium]
MPRNVYHEINFHIVWRTKNDVPSLIGDIERHVWRHLRKRAIDTGGVFVHEIGGMPDHIHMAVSVPPTVLVSEWIGKLKGGSSHFINHEVANAKVLDWQTGYGIVSFGSKDLPWVVEYIRNQKEHHAASRVYDRLERIELLD